MATMELTKIWFEVKKHTESREIAEGLCLEWYGEKGQYNRNPISGEIKKDDKGFYIEWEDISEKTRINDSEHSKEILNRCGWTN